MYDNIGEKIKGLAKVIFILGAVLSFIAGFILILSYLILIFAGLLICILGPIFSWILSCVLYGFGELIDKACDIERNTRKEKTQNLE